MIQAFVENPVLLLFVVIGIGYGLGSIRIRGSSLGVAAVLFVGLLFGGLSRELHVPEEIIFLGLAMFVYLIGLSSGPSFFATFQQRGARDVVFVILMLTLSAAAIAGIHLWLGFQAAATAGVFAGSTTNTPALAGLLDVIGGSNQGGDYIRRTSELAVVGYSLSYPMGVLGAMAAIAVMQRLLRVDYQQEERELGKDYPVKQQIESRTLRITHQAICDTPIRDLKARHEWPVVFGRMQRGEAMRLTNWDTAFRPGDLVAVVGDARELDRVGAELGEYVSTDLTADRTEYDIRKIFVSNPRVAGQKLAALNLQARFAAVVTRVIRGDMDLLASPDTVLELGDRVVFVARRRDIPRLADLFGDSYDALSRINLLSFSLGMGLGLLLGMITFQLPGGVSFQLGYAGGPLLVALTLGALRRTGPVVWTLPYGANLTLQQIALSLMLAGIGINSGHTFINTIAQGEGGYLFLAGTLISLFTALVTLWIGYKLLRIPFSFLIGMISNQPAVLDYATTRAGNKLPHIGYTLMLPVAIVIKILYVQLLFLLLR